MRRLVLYLLSAAAVALAIWLVAGAPSEPPLDRVDRTGEPSVHVTDSASAGATRPGSGTSAPSAMHAPGTSAPTARMGETPAGAQPSARDRVVSAPEASAAAGSSDSRVARSLGGQPPSDPGPSDPGSSGLGPSGPGPSNPEATGSAPQLAVGIPLGGAAQAPAGPAPDSTPRATSSGERPAPDDPAMGALPAPIASDAEPPVQQTGTESGEGLSPAEIAQRAEQAVPEDAAPSDQIEPLRERVGEDIATKSSQAADWAN